MNVIVDVALLIIGFIALWLSSDRTILYTAHAAESFGLSKLFMGFVLLAVSTGLPELLVAIQSLLVNKAQLSVGDIVGSNFVDISLALGISATFVGPILVVEADRTRQLIMLSLSALIMIFVFSVNQLTKLHGALLILCYLVGIVWLWQTRRVSLKHKEYGKFLQQSYGISNDSILLRLFISLMLVIISSKICVSSALNIANNLTIPLDIIGASIFAAGTSLPEISLNVQAVRKRQYSLAIGNSVGSVFEQGALILGLLALSSPSPLTLHNLYGIVPFMFFSFCIVFYSIASNKTISRAAGLILMGAYILFVWYELWHLGKFHG